jgi:hypothetical protein
VTEPPEPRRPEEDGGEEEVPGLDELLDSDWLDEMEDDILLDRLGHGEDNRTIYDEHDDELQDAAHDWREDIEDVPVPPKLDPEALIAEANRRAQSSGSRGTSERNDPVSAQDESARLLQLADSANSRYMCAEIVQDLDGVLGQIQEALGANHSRLGEALGPISEAKAQAEALAAALENAFGQLRDIGNAIG